MSAALSGDTVIFRGDWISCGRFAVLRLHCGHRTECLCVVFWIYFFLSLSLSHSSCLWRESQWRGRFFSEGECAFCSWTVFALSLSCVQAHWAGASLSVREQMSGAPPVTRNYTWKQTKTREHHKRWVTAGLRTYSTADTTPWASLTYIIYHIIADHLSCLTWESSWTQASSSRLCLVVFSLSLI